MVRGDYGTEVGAGDCIFLVILNYIYFNAPCVMYLNSLC